MNILDALKQLRNDIKAWVTINLNALNAKIDEKTIPIDNKLSSTSTNPVQNKAITEAINNIPRFSGDYNDLTNAPSIAEDDSGDMIVADESGNIIFRINESGIETTQVASSKVVAGGIDLATKIAEQNIDIANHTDDQVRHITSKEREDWNAKATINDINNAVAGIVDSAPETLNTLNELSAALGNDENFATTVITALGKKTEQSDFDEHLTNDTVHVTASERNTWNNKSNFSGDYNDLTNKPDISEDESGNLVIADDDGNIIFRSDSNGIETTSLTANTIIVNGSDIKTELDTIKTIMSEDVISIDEINEICGNTMANYLDSIAAEEVGF